MSIWTITSVATLDNLACPQANELSARIVSFIFQENHLNGWAARLAQQRFSKIQLKVHNLNLCLKSYNRSVSILSTEPVVWYISPTRGSLSGGTKVYVFGRGKWKIFYSSFLDLLQCDLASSKGSVVTMICKKTQVQQWKITSWTTSFLMGQLVFLHGQTVPKSLQGIREFIA